MSTDVLETVIAGFMRLRLPESVFCWQGGEPTLARVQFYRRAAELQQRYGASGQVVANAFQTNGVLVDDEWCRLFHEYRFLVGLSLDGPIDVHDAVRRNRAGEGSWSKVMAAAERMRHYGVEFNVLCVVHSGNVSLGSDLLRWFQAHGFDHVQFIPCIERNMPHTVSAEAYGAFLCDTFDYWSREGFGRVSARDFDAILAARQGRGGQVCTYARKCDQYIVIEHNGDVYPCDFFVTGEWKLGNVKDSPLDSFIELDKFKAFAYQKDKVPACRECPWRQTCHGGCQKDRLVGGTTSDPTILCSAYKRFFRHAMPRFNTLAKRMPRDPARAGSA